MMGDLPEWKRERVVSFFGWPTQGKEMASLLWVTYPGKKKWRMVSFLWVTYPENMVLLWWVTYPEKEEWSHSYGWPTQKRKSGLILMGDLPKGGMASFLWVTYPDEQKMENGLILMGDLPREVWSHCDGWPAQGKRKSGLILWVTYPGGENVMKWSRCDGRPTQIERIWSAVSL